ncbi:MAG TPA: PA14 domain-containing protein [Oligoflexus sp.]|uniref:PA14 domain-containing protein n=1 Tax=Oligoflexus sp. TaxID=1971216 RepID=UPI002D2723F9|nr:PA14 domain-containing protein [Oligoflexus sp.]HYX31568.1 PA14 domain-containing protein [Oligoflexus sp.]
MHKVYSRFCLALGLSLLLTACGDPAQFNEITFGEAIPVDQNPEMSTLPDIKQDKDIQTTTPGYAGEESPTAEQEPAAEVVETEDPAQSESPTPASEAKLFADCEDSPDKGIVAELFELPANTSRLPDFQTLSSLRTVCLSQLNIQDRQFSEGFPGVENLFEWFALDMKFNVNVPRNGIYEFSLVSDDGAILWIDNAQIINNDGLHEVTEKKARIYLEAGSHAFRVAYYQGPRWRIALELFWKIPGASTRTYIPANAISRAE